ncbi:hypothetical protein SCH01S_20_00100 [Sphingomonas changbaiensis NBRC 104936]|uniref:Cell envelope biogenesis protein TolA n=1 Tax=Sphingomonas changbaiensis NBRC 104936 TaxID=1219043 RepID=A0A0E9MMQ7_9SPHN|nr:hypothetical protein [Sphingomonas changbaiensis]GAO38803.1 hypothetical protein SCH01S_20_00100 [Sphingomonas changbaiensis NBRC 104936]
MPRAQKLKVYCTPIGFHNAYVAAPSQKAALEAWGSDANLFARGVAEQVTDPTLMTEPLARPGKVIRKLRGTAEEQIAALPELPKAKSPKPTPRPSRAPVEEAEQALAELEERQRDERERLARREAELARERRALEERQRKELERASKARDRTEANYEKALAKWRG